jgi:hypothetical protein
LETHEKELREAVPFYRLCRVETGLMGVSGLTRFYPWELCDGFAQGVNLFCQNGHKSLKMLNYEKVYLSM